MGPLDRLSEVKPKPLLLRLRIVQREVLERHILGLDQLHTRDGGASTLRRHESEVDHVSEQFRVTRICAKQHMETVGDADWEMNA